MLGAALLVDLVQAVAKVFHQEADELLAHDLFGLGAHVAPFLAQRYPEAILVAVQGPRLWREGCAGV
jgi:hypothetical protein